MIWESKVHRKKFGLLSQFWYLHFGLLFEIYSQKSTLNLYFETIFGLLFLNRVYNSLYSNKLEYWTGLNWHGRDIETVEVLPNLAEGLSGRVDPQSITFSLTRRLFDNFLLVNDDEIARAVAYCYNVHGEVVEGAAAVGLAALLGNKEEHLGRSVGVLITGGNITQEQHRNILERAGN